MYFTKGIEAIATITELRSNTSELLDHAREIESGILIQKNNEPYAVLVNYEVYERMLHQNEKRSSKDDGKAAPTAATSNGQSRR